MKRSVLIICAILVVSALLLVGAAPVLTSQSSQQGLLSKFGSIQEFTDFVVSHSGSGNSYPLMAEDDASSGTAAASYSGTNVQVQGVDEADRVKTDGTYIYIADGPIVHILKTSPGGSMSNLSEINMTGSDANAYYHNIEDSPISYIEVEGLYLYADHLVVLFSQTKCYGMGGCIADAYMPYYPSYGSQSNTYALVYDVADPARPVLDYSTGSSGNLIGTRMIGETLYLIIQQGIWWGVGITLPEIWDDGAEKEIPAQQIFYDRSCSDVSTFTTLLALDVSTMVSDTTTVITGASSTIYMSSSSMYLTAQKWSGGTSQLSMMITTTIYRIEVAGTEMTIAAKGEVDGMIIDQFSMDEKNGLLRLATTTWNGEGNQVYILGPDLGLVGSLKGISPGERIYSSRFIDDRLYLVTFRQTDPLQVIDLSNVTAPKLLGELKVPGVSTYLQMIDLGLLGIGSENGSLKVSLYNITDPGHPREIATYEVSGCSYTPAQYDAKALLYDARSHLLTIPVERYAYSNVYSPETGFTYYIWSGVEVLEMDGSSISLKGAIEHANSSVQRSLYIGDSLYTISDTTIRANHLPDLASEGELILGCGTTYGVDICYKSVVI